MLRIILVICMSLASSSVMAGRHGYDVEIERRTQRPGGDYTSFRSRNARICARECTDDPRCRAFDFYTSDGSCWLKDRVPPARHNRGVVSGVKEKRRPDRLEEYGMVAGIRLDVGIDRVGKDYTHFVVDDVRQCARECVNDPRCQALGYDTRDSSCWLKDGVPSQRQKWYVTSGVKQRNAQRAADCNLPTEYDGLRLYPDMKRYGSDYNIFTARSVRECARACARDNQCRSFNYGKDRGDCWLKNRVPEGVFDSSAVSGVKGGAVPGWAIGTFTGKNKRDWSDVSIRISPDGDVEAIWDGMSHTGYFEGGTIQLGRLNFIVKRRRNGFETILRSDHGNRVYFQRSR